MMASSDKNNKVGLKIFVDQLRNKVFAARANKDFVDILLSFLTLPLGTLVKATKNRPVAETTETGIMGCMYNLYESVEKLGNENFVTDTGKTVLLNPRNPLAEYCLNLKVNVDDYHPGIVFTCSNSNTNCDRLCEYSHVKCPCGGIFDKQAFLERPHSTDDCQGTFIKGKMTFIITDDLKVTTDSPSSFNQVCRNSGIYNVTQITKMDVNIGLDEISSLLKYSLISRSPMTDVFIPIIMRLRSSRIYNVNQLLQMHGEGGSRIYNVSQLTRTPGEGGSRIYNVSQRTQTHREGGSRTYNVSQLTQTHREGQAPLWNSRIDNLNQITQMHVDIGLNKNRRLRQILDSATAIPPVPGNIPPSFPVVGGASTCKLSMKIVLRKSTKRVLFAEVNEDFVDFLLSFFTFPLGSVVKLLDGNSGLGCVDNLFGNVKCLDTELLTLSPDKLLDAGVKDCYKCPKQPLRIHYTSSSPFVDPRHLAGQENFSNRFVKTPSLFVLTENLTVIPLSSASSVDFLKEFHVPVSDIEERAIIIGEAEALCILKASLTSSAALTNSLKYFRQWSGRSSYIALAK